MIYITGDTHGRFERVERFCERFQTSRISKIVAAALTYSIGYLFLVWQPKKTEKTKIFSRFFEK